ncbi:unnamed protein product [Cuscuta campestris]|uniref:3'-5' exonuclease domain-containing protein n=1 Tax=Cuscuta campestris TaxID=132261 RepID=A0A484KJD1_9ASTE|nr:unnamed protein product [Cuscuta campestris]
MARVHDESLKYVLSDQAIVSLSKDLNNLIQDDDNGEALLESLEKCLGANGTCPLSPYNYVLLSETSLDKADRSQARNETRKTSLARKVLQELFNKSYQPQFCKSPAYDNCRIYTSDGRFLCFCARRRFDWYLKRNLAKLVNKDPPSIMLLFEPKQRPEDDDNEFSNENKKNVCVGCGKGEHYKRYRIIPLCYTRHFPEHLKSYRYHNIVLLCTSCHQVAHVAGERYKEKIATDYGIPLLTWKPVVNSCGQVKMINPKLPALGFVSDDQDQESEKLSALGSGLDDRIQESRSDSVQSMNDANDSSKQCMGHGAHGKQVVEFILKENGDEGIRGFVQRWREDFVDAIHPRFLLARWNTNRITESQRYDSIPKMENNDKVKLALKLTIASCVALSLSFFLASKLQNPRRRRSRTIPSSSPCYLKAEESKPQYAFKRVLADNSYSPFKHLKLHSAPDECLSLHPYKAEISDLLSEPNVEALELLNQNLEELAGRDSYIWVETELQLQELAEMLSGESVFAVDTEQHSLRSFLGFTCLIQISTKEEDYLLDVIAMHDFMGILHPIFANPKICKVFHGADNDVLWLQRDFHIYIVNLFDTAKACDVLSKPQRSLAYLLETYCGVSTNKQLQREDWRQRPLPAEMVLYAQNDAHYLLYIAHNLFKELKIKDSEHSGLDQKMTCVLEATCRSNTTSLQLFSKELEAFPGESAASSITSRYHDQGNLPSSSFNFQDLVRQLCAWRDIMARVHDESLRYVLSEQAIVALAANPPPQICDICYTISEADSSGDHISPSPSPSSLVCSHLEDLNHLFEDGIGESDENLLLILQKCLGANGRCPLSIYNYALLSKTSLKVANRSIIKKNGFKSAKSMARKTSRELFVQKFSCKSPVYHNCRIYANDGRLLCYCDRRKLEWYLNRSLAKLVEENPPAIMLLFEPKGRPEDEDNDFYIQSKKNICVGCGEGNHYLRYRIIPSCYRMHFPEHLKSHRSHDIVLLCVDCHEIAHAAAERFKKKIAAEYGIPLFVRKVVHSNQTQNPSVSSPNDNIDEEDGVSPLQLRTAAMALLRHGSRMPSRRKDELKEIVRSYYGGREISQGDLENALLVGMSPLGRRRFVKKKLSSKQPTTYVASDHNQEPSTDDAKAKSTTHENGTGMQHNKGNTRSMDFDNQYSAHDNTFGLNCIVSESGNIYTECDSVQSNNDVNVPSKQHSKVSMLGHGPHGKQVVEFILNEYGEEGVCEFCQRWRQVFVETVHPRFLPAGWNVTHSGKRDFGEYSIYNPEKRDSAGAG